MSLVEHSWRGNSLNIVGGGQEDKGQQGPDDHSSVPQGLMGLEIFSIDKDPDGVESTLQINIILQIQKYCCLYT